MGQAAPIHPAVFAHGAGAGEGVRVVVVVAVAAAVAVTLTVCARLHRCLLASFLCALCACTLVGLCE
eukprot:5829980-Alexandrium_andersonii.AAC.1